MRLVVWGALLLNIGTVIGCGFFYLDIFTCPHPDHDHVDAMGKRDPCHERDPDAGADAGEVDAAEADVANAGCPEERVCVPPGPNYWQHFPWLTWIGPNGQAPPCPGRASHEALHGYARLVVPEPACAGCTCAPSAGSCKIPSGFKAHAAPLCAATATETPFPAPSGWDGTCNKEGPIDGGALCGTVPCVQSISIDKLAIEEEGCAVGTTPAPVGAYFELETRGCSLGGQGACDNGSYECVAVADPFPGGFRHCVWTNIDVAGEPCPAGYPDGPYTFYEEMADSRVCNCTCGDPVGSKCTAVVSVYEDGACTQPVFQNAMIDSADPYSPCWNVPSGVAVGSKEITDPIYHPGTCEPKGEPVGEVQLGRPTILCCTAAQTIP